MVESTMPGTSDIWIAIDGGRAIAPAAPAPAPSAPVPAAPAA